MSFRRHVNASPNVYSGCEYVKKIKVSLTIVTVFLVCHLPRIFSDVQEIVCNSQLSLDEEKRAKVSFFKLNNTLFSYKKCFIFIFNSPKAFGEF